MHEAKSPNFYAVYKTAEGKQLRRTNHHNLFELANSLDDFDDWQRCLIYTSDNKLRDVVAREFLKHWQNKFFLDIR